MIRTRSSLAALVLCATILAGCKTWQYATAMIVMGGASQAMAGHRPPPPAPHTPYTQRPPELETVEILARALDGGPILVERRVGERWTLRPGLCGWTRLYSRVHARWEYPRVLLVGPDGQTCSCWIGERIVGR